MKTYPLLN